MAQRYFFGNTLAAFFRSSSAVVEVTTAGRFDSTFVASGISTPGSSDYLETMPFIDAASTTTLWTHFELYATAASVATAMVQIFNSAGLQVARLISTVGGSVVKLQYWNGSAFVDANGGATATFTTNTLTRFDIKAVAGAGGGLSLYLNGSLAIADTGAGLHAAVTNFAHVRLTGGAQNAVWSQVLGADFDTRDSRLYSQLANGNGANTDGTGTYSDINEPVLDESTSIALSTSGQKKTFTKGSMTLPAGYMIGAVGVAGRARINGSGPPDADFLIRSGGTDHASSALGLNTGYEPRGRLWTADPGTASDWTQAGYNAAEFGLKAL